MSTDSKPLVTADGQIVNPHAFTEWIGENWPMLDLELSEALAEGISATQLHHLNSTITLTLNIGQGEGFFGELLITPKVNAKPAKPKADAQPFFPTDQGGLSVSDDGLSIGV